ncbi:MAG: alpha-N-arabinofuranosidase [Candidatus Limiplasma sp.]|nr:alpha-N-arabinofuranosidase [Candidatus Limiplasma sp.]
MRATMVLDREFTVGPVDPRLFGSLVEHLGRAVYGGLYEPGHPTADADGFRGDVLALTRDLGVTTVRYPGGNFVSGFDWEDSVGPQADRPRRLELAWQSTETNEVGLHEFMRWCARAGAQPMYAVNLGTRGIDAARAVVEYANYPGGSVWADRRIANGAREPFGIKLWCLGNEMDGPWQIGHRTALEYGRLANESAKVMKWVDPTIEVVACGSSYPEMPTFGDWELTMLDACYENVDYVSLHRYYENKAGDTRRFLARSEEMGQLIHTVTSVCDAVGGKKHLRKRLNLSFDEWNVWFHSAHKDQEAWERDRWGRALPLLEDVYTFEDALLVGGMLITLLKNADRVKIACLAQLVNVIAPICTRTGGGAWKQTIYWPFQLASRYGRGTALRAVVNAPVYDCDDLEAVPEVDATATLEADGSVSLFALNRSLTEPAQLSCDLRGFAGLARMEHTVLHHADVHAVNTEAAPDVVRPMPGPGGTLENGKLEVTLPPLSWSLIRVIKA